jgi:hypothetical protein
MSALKTLLLCVAVLLLINVQAWSQRAAELAGIASDSSGQVIPGAQVNATNQETGVKLSTITNDAGAYRFVEVVAGTYRIEATFSGFKTFVTSVVLETSRVTAN